MTAALAEFSSVSLMGSGLNAAAAELSEVIRSARALFAPDAASRDSVFHDPFFHDPQLDGALADPAGAGIRLRDRIHARGGETPDGHWPTPIWWWRRTKTRPTW